MKKSFLALILAAGKGTRFKSENAKVLHPLLGKPMLRWVVESIFKLRPEKIYIVVGCQREEIIRQTFSKRVDFVIQRRQLGTAHAVLAAKAVLRKNMEKDALVINGDLPLVRPQTLRPFLACHLRKENSLTFLTADLEDPAGFGRVVYPGNGKIRIIEEKDASPSEKKIRESNIGIYLFKIKDLLKALPLISNENKKKEYYLTDIVEIMSLQGKKVSSYKVSRIDEFVGINDRFELARAIDVLRLRKIKSLAEDGVTVLDPSTTWIDQEVKIGKESVIYPSVIIEGQSVIGRKCRLYPFVHIVSSRLGDRVKVMTSTVMEECLVEDEAQVGPFSRLRPKTVLRKGARVGNFVEMKNTVFGRQSKAMHLSYLGDSEVEEDVNIGAGTITCNYDGFKKSKTYIAAGVFVGSGTKIVAPLKIGKDAYIAAGSTITRNVSPGALAVSRSRQVEKPGWALRRKRK